MIDETSIQAVSSSKFGEHFLKPLYDGYAFAQLPATIRGLLTESAQPSRGIPFGGREDLRTKYDTVVLFFIDAFGWCFLERFLDRPFLKRIVNDGFIAKISSQFPSTTAAHVTTIHTGLSIGQSGIYEWNYYEPTLDAVISPLLFSFAGDKDRDTLQAVHANPQLLFPTDTVYRDLANHGVKSYVLQDHQYTHSPYTEVVTAGATLVPYRSFPEAIISLAELLKQQTERSYYFLYYDKIDSVSHHHGPMAMHTEAEIESVLWMMERFLVPVLQAQKGRTLFLMTADHGHIGIDPATTIYLNETMPEIIPLLRRSRNGNLIVPCGSPRDMFLHIVEGKLNEACVMLKEKLQSRAEVHRTDDLISEGFFGSASPSAAFMSRIGDLVILPYAEESVWWHEPGRFEQKYYGYHGGLTPEEMETVLIAQPF